MTPVTGSALSMMMIGMTHYVDAGHGSDAVIYYPTRTKAIMRLPGAPVMTGTLTVSDRGYHINWNDGPEGDWQIAYHPDEFIYLAPDGTNAGTIKKLVTGNAEGL